MSVIDNFMPMGSSSRFGQYEVFEEIGHGGMATVHRAVLNRAGGFKRPVVIKRLLPELAKDEYFIKMFVEEARLSALLDHPNIVQIYDFGLADAYFIAMEYIEGTTVGRLMRHFNDAQPFPGSAAAYIMQQVCLGFHYAHTLKRDGKMLRLVHRDVSPSNIMLSVHGAVKVLDFGIAKARGALENEETRTGTFKGKWSYTSPEQVEGHPATAKSDIFATGIVMWEMLTGRRLFRAKTDYLTLSNVVRAKVPPVTRFRPDLPPVFDEICARALARKPEDRYNSAAEMAEHLGQVLVSMSFGAFELTALVKDAVMNNGPGDSQELLGADGPGQSSPDLEDGDGKDDLANAAYSHASAAASRKFQRGLKRRQTLWATAGGVMMAIVAVTGAYFWLQPSGSAQSDVVGVKTKAPAVVQVAKVAQVAKVVLEAKPAAVATKNVDAAPTMPKEAVAIAQTEQKVEGAPQVVETNEDAAPARSVASSRSKRRAASKRSSEIAVRTIDVPKSESSKPVRRWVDVKGGALADPYAE